MNTAGLKKKINQKYYAVFAGLILVLVLAGILALCVGRYWVPFPDVVKVLLSRVFPVSGSWDANTESVVMTLRLPRVAAAVLVGGSLALSGAVYQGVFQNPQEPVLALPLPFFSVSVPLVCRLVLLSGGLSQS